MKMSLPFIKMLIVISISVLSETRLNQHHHYSNKKRMHPLSDEFIDFINTQQNLWTAGRNFHKSTPLSHLKILAGTIIDESKRYEIFMDDPPLCGSKELPKNFDARRKWPYCGSISTIRDQGACGSCWAVGVASVMTDRLCIITTATEKELFSEQDLLGCCKECRTFKSDVCQPGYLDSAWGFAKRIGVVSGGDYKTSGGCKAYQLAPCNHTAKYDALENPCIERQFDMKCNKTCTTNEEIDYNGDKKRFGRIYSILNHDPMCEILSHGPITATMNVYADFYTYKKGVYRHHDDSGHTILGNHTVRILGWGVDVDTQTKYWLGANSWNTGWGDEGFFKIVRGENHCNIEKYMMAGKL